MTIDFNYYIAASVKVGAQYIANNMSHIFVMYIYFCHSLGRVIIDSNNFQTLFVS